MTIRSITGLFIALILAFSSSGVLAQVYAQNYETGNPEVGEDNVTVPDTDQSETEAGDIDLAPELELDGEEGLEAEEAEEAEVQILDYQFTIARVFGVFVPNFVLNGWLDLHPSHWSDGKTNFAVGSEFIIRRPNEYDLVFSFDWADLGTTDGWWKESGEDIADSDWGENSLSLLTLDIAVNWFTEVKPFWHVYYGLGLGLAVVLGDFMKTDIDVRCLEGQGIDPYRETDGEYVLDNCDGDDIAANSEATEEERLPPVIPALSLTLGSRWIIQDNWVVQVETGFKTAYFYSGLELGYTWR
jgi:hypothetical protein